MEKKLGHCDGIVVAPGFGSRGVEGKLLALRYAREKGIPTLGICLGMQCMAIEYARNVLGYKDANTAEIDANTAHKVIDLMDNQKNVTDLGGSMRLGGYPCRLKKNSKLEQAYGKELIRERHRHRYEFNSAFLDEFEQHGFHAVGINPDNGLIEALELDGHPWYIGVQYHPEYKSTVLNPSPLFMSFIQAAIAHQAKTNK